MNEHLNKRTNGSKVEKQPKPAKPETKGLTAVKPEEMKTIEGGACAFLRIPPYWRCW